MAKISANKGSKVAERSIDRVAGDSHGGVLRIWYVLTSDGRILRASSYPLAPNDYDRKRSSYTIAARIKADHTRPLLDVFNAYVDRRARLARQNYSLDTGSAGE